jgi:hypothetical protein
MLAVWQGRIRQLLKRKKKQVASRICIREERRKADSSAHAASRVEHTPNRKKRRGGWSNSAWNPFSNGSADYAFHTSPLRLITATTPSPPLGFKFENANKNKLTRRNLFIEIRTEISIMHFAQLNITLQITARAI